LPLSRFKVEKWGIEGSGIDSVLQDFEIVNDVVGRIRGSEPLPGHYELWWSNHISHALWKRPTLNGDTCGYIKKLNLEGGAMCDLMIG
jgi:hypothetical protein